MFYRKINDIIIDCADFKYCENAIYTNKKLIEKYTGEIVFEEDFLKSATMEELEKQKKFEKSLKNV